MQPKSIKALAACLCLALVANACALPETSQVPGATLEQAMMVECPTPVSYTHLDVYKRQF